MFDEKQMQYIFERHFTRILGDDAELIKREFSIGRGNRYIVGRTKQCRSGMLYYKIKFSKRGCFEQSYL